MKTASQKEKRHIIKNGSNMKPMTRIWNNLPLITKPMKQIRNQNQQVIAAVSTLIWAYRLHVPPLPSLLWFTNTRATTNKTGQLLFLLLASQDS